MKNFLLALLILPYALFAVPPTSFAPNAYECEGEGFSLTYSTCAWHTEPIWVYRVDGNMHDGINKRGNKEISRKRSLLGIEVSVEEHSIAHFRYLSTLLLPEISFDGPGEVTFDTLLIKNVVTTDVNLPVLAGFQSYYPLKCKASFRVD